MIEATVDVLVDQVKMLVITVVLVVVVCVVVNVSSITCNVTVSWSWVVLSVNTMSREPGNMFSPATKLLFIEPESLAVKSHVNPYPYPESTSNSTDPPGVKPDPV